MLAAFFAPGAPAFAMPGCLRTPHHRICDLSGPAAGAAGPLEELRGGPARRR